MQFRRVPAKRGPRQDILCRKARVICPLVRAEPAVARFNKERENESIS